MEQVRNIGLEECRDMYGSLTDRRVAITADMMCAGDSGAHACRGDSGAPLLHRAGAGGRWTVRGIVSFGPAKCGRVPGVYVRVDKYLGWIREEMRQ